MRAKLEQPESVVPHSDALSVVGIVPLEQMEGTHTPVCCANSLKRHRNELLVSLAFNGQTV